MDGNSTLQSSPHPSDLMLSIVIALIGAIGVPGNFCLIIIIVFRSHRRKPHELLLLFLAISDFLFALSSLTLEAPLILHPHRSECRITGPLYYFFGTFSMYAPPLMAYNRYLSLYDNQKYRRLFTNTNVVLAWLLIALIGASWIFPFAVTGHTGQDDLGLCGIRIDNDTFLVCVLVLVVCVDCFTYTGLVYFAWKVVARIRCHSRRSLLGRGQQRSRVINESREIITVVIVISAVPLVTQVPAVTLKLLHSFMPPFDPWIGRAAISVFPTAAAVNAYVTIYVVRKYRKMVRTTLDRCSTFCQWMASNWVEIDRVRS